jgi:hypothetical protein
MNVPRVDLGVGLGLELGLGLDVFDDIVRYVL